MNSNTPISTKNAPRISLYIGGSDATDPPTKGEKISGWEGLSVEKSIDSAADGFAFSVPFNPTVENYQRFKPFGVQAVKVYANDQKLITGYIENVSSRSEANSRGLELQGRSITGVLVDWSAGYEYDGSDPRKPITQIGTFFQFENVSFNTIAKKLSGPYTVKAIPDVGPFPDVAIEPGQSVYDVLSSLAAANGLWAQTTPDGELIFSKIQVNAPVADLIQKTGYEEGRNFDNEASASPVISVDTNHDVTKRYRGYIALADADGSPEVSAAAEDRSFGLGKRGVKIIQANQKSADYSNAAKFARARALISSYTVSVTVTGWTHHGQFWNPGDVVRLKAPGAFIPQLTKLIIKRVAFKFDSNSGQTTQLDLTFPESYKNELPESLPWAI